MISALSRVIAPPAPTYEVRRHARIDLVEACTVERWGRSFHAMTRNISKGGICVDILGMGSTILDAELTIHLRDFAPVSATARWSHKRTFGIQFDKLFGDDPDLAAFIEDLEAQAE